MTDNDEHEHTDERGIAPTRRQLIAALGAAGVFGAVAAGQSRESNPHDADSRLTAGGGPMTDALSHKEIQWIEDEYSERPDPGVERRFFFATDQDTVYRDTGTAWETVSIGSRWESDGDTLSPQEGEPQSVSIDRASIGESVTLDETEDGRLSISIDNE